MSADSMSRFEELVSRYLDEGLTEAAAAELAGLLEEPRLAARFLEMTRLNSEIAGLLSAPVPDAAMVDLVRPDIEKALAGEQPPGVRLRFSERIQTSAKTETNVVSAPSAFKSRRKALLRALPWAAVFLLFAGLAAIIILNRTRSSEAGTVASIEGEIRRLGSQGEQALKERQSWQRGETLKTVGAKSTATVTFSDRSRLVLSEDCIVRNQSTREEHRVELDHGALQAVVTKQPTKRPFLLVTPEAEALVVGTALRLVTGGHHTRLEVTEGEVLFRRLHDGAEVSVEAGNYAVVAPNVPFVVRPIHANPHHP